MSTIPRWLPPVIQLSEHGGNWEKYLEKVYNVFHRDFVLSCPRFNHRPIVHDRHLSDGKEETFWHVSSEDDSTTGERIPNLRRCERMRWIRAIIEHADEECVSVWRNKRKQHRRILLWFEQADYLVVLEEKCKRIILVTAYCTDREHTRRKLRRERQRSQKSKRRL